MSGGQFDWGGRLQKGNGGARRSPQNDWKPFKESVFSLPLLLTFQHRAGVSPYTSPLGFAETCVFAKQSLEPLFCDQLSLAPLLPKLRGHFAEFLNNTSPVGLWIFSSSTCVGLRYGYK